MTDIFNHGRPLTRIQPAMPVQAYKTYGIAAPRDTHTRKASCREVECQHYGRGWQSVINTNTELGRRQANYIRMSSGRHFTFTENNGVVTFVFAAGQKCFTEHRVKLDRQELFVVRGGDWRAVTSEVIKRSPENWVDDFANHQDRIATKLKQG